MSNSARKARKRQGIKLERTQKEGTPLMKRAEFQRKSPSAKIAHLAAVGSLEQAQALYSRFKTFAEAKNV